jgi:hypothetical protein
VIAVAGLFQVELYRGLVVAQSAAAGLRWSLPASPRL